MTQPGPVGSMRWCGPLEENKWGEPACGAGGRKMIGGERRPGGWRESGDRNGETFWKLEVKY